MVISNDIQTFWICNKVGVGVGVEFEVEWVSNDKPLLSSLVKL